MLVAHNVAIHLLATNFQSGRTCLGARNDCSNRCWTCGGRYQQDGGEMLVAHSSARLISVSVNSSKGVQPLVKLLAQLIL